MTVVNPDSIAGITSVTSSGTTLEFYDVNGNLLDVSANLTGELTVGTGATISSPGASIIDFETNGSERLRIGSSGQIGIAGANYGSSGQVLTSAGSGSAVSWSTIPTQVTLNNNADNRVITGGSGVNLNGEANLTFDGTTLQVENSGSGLRNLLRLKNSNASAGVSGLYFNSTTSGSAFDAACVRNGVNGSGQGRLYLQTNNGSGLVNGLEIEYDGQVTLPTNSLNILDSIVHIGDTNTKIRFPAADTFTVETAGSERLRISSNGSVGINTTADTRQLEIYNSSHATAALKSDTQSSLFFSDPADTNIGQISYMHSSNYMYFRVNDAERLRIDSAGRVLIGHTSSTVGGRVELQRAGAESWITINESSDSGSGPALYINRTRGSNLGSPTPVQNGNWLGNIWFGSYDTNSYEKGARISAVADGQTWANNDCPTRLSLWTTRDGETNPREWMRIWNDGSLTFARGGSTQSVSHNLTHLNGKHRYSFDYSTDDSTVPFRGMRVYGSYGIGGGSSDYSYAALFDGGKTHNNCNNQYITFNQITQQLVASTHGIYCENTSSYSASYCYEGKMMKNLGAYTDAYTYHSNIVTSNSGGTAYHYYATDNGTLKFRVYQNGNAQNANNSWGSTSDIKLKENIVDASSQWADIKAIKVRNFNFKASTGQDTSRHIGVIAQEIETISPGLVHTDNDTTIDEATGEGTVTGTTKSVKYSILYMKAIKALQEAMTRIETLESEVQSIKTQQANDAAYEAKIDKIIDYFKL